MIDAFAHLSLKLDLVSSGVVTIAAGQTANIDISFNQLRHVTGAEYFKQNGNFEDTISFQIINTSSLVAAQLATDILTKEYNSYNFYKATIQAGYTTRIIYKNNGILDAKFAINLVCHQDKE